MTNIINLLNGKMTLSDVKLIADWSSTPRGGPDTLLNWTTSQNHRVSVNSLWVMTHLDESMEDWLTKQQSFFINRLLSETDVTRKRLLLQLLKKQRIDIDSELTSHLLDYCLSKINAESEPYAVRCFSLYVAFDICRHFPELLRELEQRLDYLELQSLSPGLKSGLRQTRQRIARLRKTSSSGH